MSQTLVLDPLNAVKQHIENGNENYFSTVATIGIYAGQLSDALRKNNVVKLRDKVPAVYIILIDDTPIAFEPVHNIDLLIVTESRAFIKLDKHEDAATISGQIANYLKLNQGWKYGGLPYLIDESILQVQNLMTDDRYSIFRIGLRIVEKL